MVFNPEAAFSRIKMLHSVAFQGRIFSIVLQNWKLGTTQTVIPAQAGIQAPLDDAAASSFVLLSLDSRPAPSWGQDTSRE
jgi:hypothetical protein